MLMSQNIVPPLCCALPGSANSETATHTNAKVKSPSQYLLPIATIARANTQFTVDWGQGLPCESEAWASVQVPSP